MIVDRRQMLAGLAAAPFARAPMETTDTALVAALDRLSPEVPPAIRLAQLADFDPARLSKGRRLDLLTIRESLAAESAIARRFPFGRPDRSPYRVTAYWGAWQGDDEDAIVRETAALRGDIALGVRLPDAARRAAIAAIRRRPETGARAALATLLEQTSPEVAPGISRLDGGAALFCLLIERHLGGRHTEALVRQRIDDALNRAIARAQCLFRDVGLRDGGIGPRYATLWRDPAYRLPPTPDGRVAAITAMNARLARIIERITPFARAFPATWRVPHIAMMSPADIAAGRAGYRDRGRYYPDLSALGDRPTWSLESTVAHEAVPGHLLLAAFESACPPHPRRLDHAPVAAEGWSVMAETIADAAGAFDDIHVQLGHVHWLIFRLCRAQADIAIHLDGASVDKALARWRDLQGVAVAYAPFESDLARIAVEPAFKTAEALAWLDLADAWSSLSIDDMIAAIPRALRYGRTHSGLYSLT